jgi:hypothetical protein
MAKDGLFRRIAMKKYSLLIALLIPMVSNGYYQNIHDYCTIYGSAAAVGFQAAHDGLEWAETMQRGERIIDMVRDQGLYYSGTPADIRRALTVGFREGQKYTLTRDELQGTMNLIQFETREACLETIIERLP